MFIFLFHKQALRHREASCKIEKKVIGSSLET